MMSDERHTMNENEFSENRKSSKLVAMLGRGKIGRQDAQDYGRQLAHKMNSWGIAMRSFSCFLRYFIIEWAVQGKNIIQSIAQGLAEKCV